MPTLSPSWHLFAFCGHHLSPRIQRSGDISRVTRRGGCMVCGSDSRDVHMNSSGIENCYGRPPSGYGAITSSHNTNGTSHYTALQPHHTIPHPKLHRTIPHPHTAMMCTAADSTGALTTLVRIHAVYRVGSAGTRSIPLYRNNTHLPLWYTVWTAL